MKIWLGCEPGKKLEWEFFLNLAETNLLAINMIWFQSARFLLVKWQNYLKSNLNFLLSTMLSGVSGRILYDYLVCHCGLSLIVVIVCSLFFSFSDGLLLWQYGMQPLLMLYQWEEFHTHPYHVCSHATGWHNSGMHNTGPWSSGFPTKSAILYWVTINNSVSCWVNWLSSCGGVYGCLSDLFWHGNVLLNYGIYDDWSEEF